MSDKLKIIFAGTPDISKGVLENILHHGFDISLVLTQPDRPSGRGLKLTASPVKQLALERGIEVFQPQSFKNNPDAIQKIRDLQPDIIVVVAYGLILPKELLEIPTIACVNIHVSLLPRWRGAAPIQRAVLAGDSETGVTIMHMDIGLDTGDILLTETIQLDKKETSATLHDKLATIGAIKIIDYLNNPKAFLPVKQSEIGVTYAHKLDKEEASIDWNESAELIERKIRGYNPFPGAFSFLDENVLHKIWSADAIVSKSHSATCGEILVADKGKLLIACGNGSVLQIHELQEAGSKRKTALQYLQNKTDLQGQIFGSKINE